MLNFQAFGLPCDGMTMVEQLESYRCNSLRALGWIMVGIVESDQGDEKKLFGVFRMTGDQALKSALEGENNAVAAKDKAETERREMERQLKDATMRIASLTARIDELMIKAA